LDSIPNTEPSNDYWHCWNHINDGCSIQACEQFSVGYLSAGAALVIFMAVIILFILIPGAIIVVGILGLLIGIPTIILLLVGLNEVKKVAENKLKQQQ
jgi:hypothetical protein